MFSSLTHQYDRELNQVVYAKRVYDATRVAMGPWRTTKAEALADEVVL